MTSSLTTGVSLDIKISNQTSDAILMMRVEDDSNDVRAAYARSLTALPDNTKPTVIAKSGGTATLKLDSPPQQEAWNLIAARADNLFPVSNQVAVVPSSGTPSHYPDITVTQAEADAMQQAFVFHQVVLSYPESDLVKNFFDLLHSTYNTDPLTLETAINQYFQQTQDYAQCTLENYTAVSTYCRNYAFAWANFQPSFTYLVFQPATDPNAEVGLVTIGKIVFTKQANAPSPADVSDHNGGYAIAYHAADGSERPLSLVDGKLVSTDNPSAPAIAFLLTYALKSTFSQVQLDTDAWPVLIGQIDGTQVIAVGDIPAASTPNLTSTSGNLTSNWHDDWVKLFSPKSADDWGKLIGIVLGMAIGVGIIVFMVYKTVQWIRTGIALGQPNPPRQDIQAFVDQINQDLKKFMPDEQSRMDEAAVHGTLAADPAKFGQGAEAARLAQIDFNFNVQRNAFVSAIIRYGDALKVLAEYGVNGIDSASELLGQASDIVKSINTLEDLNLNRVYLKAALGKVSAALGSLFKNAKNAGNMSQEARLQFEQGKTAGDSSVDVADGCQEDIDDLQTGKVAIQTQAARIQAAKESAKTAADKALADFEAQLEAVANLNDGEEVQAAGNYFETAREAYNAALASGDFTGVSNNLTLGQQSLDAALKEVLIISPELQAKLDAWERSVADFSETAQQAKDVITDADTEIIEE